MKVNWNRKPFVVKCKRTGVMLCVLNTRIPMTPHKEIDVSRLGQAQDLHKRSNILELLEKKLVTIS